MRRMRIFGAVIIALLLVVPLSAYVTLRQLSNTNAIVQVKWAPGAFPLKWQMNPTVGANVAGTATQEDVLKASFASWQALTSANISFTELGLTAATVKPGYDTINLVTSNVTAAEYGSTAIAFTNVFSFDQGGVIDQYDRPIDFAGQILEADIVFNPSLQFSTSSTAVTNRFDMQTIATHEIGHFLGMDHSGQISSTMFPYSIQGVTYARTLSTDDIAGVSSVYPKAEFLSKSTLSGTTTAARPWILSRLLTCWTKLSCLLEVVVQKSGRLYVRVSRSVSPFSFTTVIDDFFPNGGFVTTKS